MTGTAHGAAARRVAFCDSELHDEVGHHAEEAGVVEVAGQHELPEAIDPVRGPGAVRLQLEGASRGLDADAEGIGRRGTPEGGGRIEQSAAGGLVCAGAEGAREREEQPGDRGGEAPLPHGLAVTVGRRSDSFSSSAR